MVPSYLRSTYRLCQQHQSILYVIIFFDEKILQKFTELPDVPPEYFQGHQGVIWGDRNTANFEEHTVWRCTEV